MYTRKAKILVKFYIYMNNLFACTNTSIRACLIVSCYNRLKEPVIICGRQMNKYVRLARRLMV